VAVGGDRLDLRAHGVEKGVAVSGLPEPMGCEVLLQRGHHMGHHRTKDQDSGFHEQILCKGWAWVVFHITAAARGQAGALRSAASKGTIG
jgi:hypothetical protein